MLGFGISGSEAVAELIERGTDPQCIVVIDPSEERLAQAEKLGCNVMAGDATRDDTLMAVRIAERGSVLVSARARRYLDPDRPDRAPSRAEGADQRGGARGRQRTARAAGRRGQCHQPGALYRAAAGRAARRARISPTISPISPRCRAGCNWSSAPVSAEEVGHPLSDLATGGMGLRIYRDGEPLGFWEADKRRARRRATWSWRSCRHCGGEG